MNASAESIRARTKENKSNVLFGMDEENDWKMLVNEYIVFSSSTSLASELNILQLGSSRAAINA